MVSSLALPVIDNDILTHFVFLLIRSVIDNEVLTRVVVLLIRWHCKHHRGHVFVAE